MTESLFYNKNTNKWEIMGLNFVKDPSSPGAPTDSYTKTEVNNLLSGKLDSSTYNTEKSNFVSKAEVYNKSEVYPKGEVYNKTEVDNTVNTLNTEITKLKAKAPIDFTIDAETTGNQVVIKFDKDTNWEASQNKIITLPHETSLVFSVNKDSNLTNIPGKLRAVSGVVIVTNANMITSFSGCILKNPIDKSMLQATEVFSYFALEDGKIYLGKVW